ncbi:hypothetical protein PQX77_002100 [Marasmius sp. AFHP31]|nr:hypothetical protein PQX77_002100 [Marasmius sp. AFHP31]
MDISYPLALASLVVEPWKPTHTSQHEFYELERSIADEVLFRVKLHGNMPAFKDRKYMYSHSSDTWFLRYFLQDSTTCVLAMDWQRIKGRLPNNMVIYPQQPTPKTNLPLMVTHGEVQGFCGYKGLDDDLEIEDLFAMINSAVTRRDTVPVDELVKEFMHAKTPNKEVLRAKAKTVIEEVTDQLEL